MHSHLAGAGQTEHIAECPKSADTDPPRAKELVEPISEPHRADKSKCKSKCKYESKSIPSTKSTPGNRCRTITGGVLVVLTQIVNVVSNEVIQFQETGCSMAVNRSEKYAPNTTSSHNLVCTPAFNHPLFSVWFNHSITGVFCAIVAFFILACRKKSLRDG